jgi:EAL domain-containing protein (putative c-di-GMP-specific phosphodiesterase class I)/GGDEF domain-containing protein
MPDAPMRPGMTSPDRDPVTGLPNRPLLLEVLAPILALASRYARGVAILHVRVAGSDAVLAEAASAIGELIRNCDVAGRVSDDGFAVALTEIWEPDAAVRVAQRLHQALQTLAEDGQGQCCGIGVAFFPPDGADAASLLDAAERALPVSDAVGFANGPLGQDALRRAGLMRDLESTATLSQFELHYQPIRALDSGAVVGAESLLRWERSGALLPAADFIDLAERSGRIKAIDRWAIERSLRDFSTWRENGWDGWLSINLSGPSLDDAGLPAAVADLIEAASTPPDALVFEITERSSLSGDGVGRQVLEELRTLGARVAVDDFGTGYASFDYLRDFDPDLVKLDRTFVAGHTGSKPDRLLVALVDLAHALGKPVVAEGVENPVELRHSIDCTCEMAQGYFLGRPISGAAFLNSHILGRQTA